MKSEVSVRTCQAHTGTRVSRLAAETDFTSCHPGNQTNVHSVVYRPRRQNWAKRILLPLKAMLARANQEREDTAEQSDAVQQDNLGLSIADFVWVSTRLPKLVQVVNTTVVTRQC